MEGETAFALYTNVAGIQGGHCHGFANCDVSSRHRNGLDPTGWGTRQLTIAPQVRLDRGISNGWSCAVGFETTAGCLQYASDAHLESQS